MSNQHTVTIIATFSDSVCGFSTADLVLLEKSGAVSAVVQRETFCQDYEHDGQCCFV